MNTYNNILAPRTVPFVTLLFARPFWPNAMQINLNTKWDTVFHKKKISSGGTRQSLASFSLKMLKISSHRGFMTQNSSQKKLENFAIFVFFFFKNQSADSLNFENRKSARALLQVTNVVLFVGRRTKRLSVSSIFLAYHSHRYSVGDDSQVQYG